MFSLWRPSLAFLALAGSLLAQAPSTPAPTDYRLEIRAERKLHAEEGKKKTTGDISKEGDEVAYDIVVANNSLKDAPALTVKYIVFVQRERLGEKTGIEHLTRVEGSGQLPALKTQAKASVVTEAFSLTKSNLKDGFYYSNGGRATARDSVKGVWVRLYDGDKFVGEYVNPTAVKTRETWDKPVKPGNTP